MAAITTMERMERKMSPGTTIGLFLILVLACGLGIILNGWVLAKLWAWFLVPVFSLPGLSIPVAIGIALIISHLTHQINIGDFEAEQKKGMRYQVGKGIGLSIFKPLIVLGFGYMVHLFI